MMEAFSTSEKIVNVYQTTGQKAASFIHEPHRKSSPWRILQNTLPVWHQYSRPSTPPALLFTASWGV
jgi:hypothetical protein